MRRIKPPSSGTTSGARSHTNTYGNKSYEHEHEHEHEHVRIRTERSEERAYDTIRYDTRATVTTTCTDTEMNTRHRPGTRRRETTRTLGEYTDPGSSQTLADHQEKPKLPEENFRKEAPWG